MSQGPYEPSEQQYRRRQGSSQPPTYRQQAVDPISRLIALQEETLEVQRQILELEKAAAEERQSANKHLARLRQAITPIEVAAWIGIVAAGFSVFLWVVNGLNG